MAFRVEYDMEGVAKYLLDYVQYQASLILGGKRNYEELRAKNYGLKTIEIKDKELAKELEDKCKKNGGFLTFAEYLDVDQFGENGYHATHTDHGTTPTHKHWGEAIATICRDKKITSVIEFGPGNGNMALGILKEAKKHGQELSWSGVELNKTLREEIVVKLAKNGFKNKIDQLVATLKELKTTKRSLIVFCYGLDSVAPEMFINTAQDKNFPNAQIGISIKDGILHEIIITPKMLKAKGIKFENGIYERLSGPRFSVNSWALYSGQRACIPIPAFSILSDFVAKFPTSAVLTIDEYRPPPSPWSTSHLCPPRDLHKFKRDIEDWDKFYRNSGDHLLYFSTYFVTFYKFLNNVGFSSVRYDIEQKMAKELVGESWASLRNYLTLSFIADEWKDNSRSIYNVEFPKAKVL